MAPEFPPGTVDSERIRVSTQYRNPVEPGVGFNTLSVYIENHGSSRIAFNYAEIDGLRLPLAKPSTLKMDAFDSIDMHGMSIPLETKQPADDLLTWWNFYPSPVVPPGGTIAFQLNFRQTPSLNHTLTLTPRKGEQIIVPLPRFRLPDRQITAVTFPLDYSKVFIQYNPDNAIPQKLWLNNREVKGFRLLPSPEPKTPAMLAATPPFPIKTGMPLHVKILFNDNAWQQTLVRAFAGISVQAEFTDEKLADAPDELGVEPDNHITILPLDVFCTDVRENKKGFSAPGLVREYVAAYQQDPDKLAGVDYCTAMFPECWDIYGAITDVAFSKPCRLGWGHNDKRFIEETEEAMNSAYLSARPRPFFFIPDPHSYRNRIIESEELDILAWMAIIRGAKGIYYRFWRWDRYLENDFLQCEPLRKQIKETNRRIADARPVLSALAFISERIIECRPSDLLPSVTSPSAGYVKLYTAWSGDRGIMLMLRNMNYTTDKNANEFGFKPRFTVEPKQDVSLTIPLPQWFKPGHVSDLRTGERMKSMMMSESSLNIESETLDSYKLIWIENKR